MKAQTLRYTVHNTEFYSHLCLPENINGKLPAILVFPEWWGLSEHAKNSAARLAEHGYIALAVDLYGNAVLTDQASQAAQMMNDTLSNPTILLERTEAALTQLQKLPETDATRIAAIGFCFGGRVALDMARRGAAIHAVTSFHGNLIPQVARAQKGKIQATILVEHGGKDTLVSAEHVADFRAEMDTAGAKYHVDIFPEAHHGFTNPQATANGEKNGVDLAYDQQAATQSWANMLAFLQNEL
ncbi:MAG: dienelactone hydrolase family protein [Alysiella sp.]|uniref:dienelactone hydrolase family protein n=1 Tax=Alysiella sp. TaxID=1872483 RepID=UPI0026DB396C|nr:dienelactone hydrolase family protein [Alysiella sp.]MDO4433050.1 dienelactone hydrolase family protein [Alysiella sp.]